jgi:hypothetical protein
LYWTLEGRTRRYIEPNKDDKMIAVTEKKTIRLRWWNNVSFDELRLDYKRQKNHVLTVGFADQFTSLIRFRSFPYGNNDRSSRPETTKPKRSTQ